MIERLPIKKANGGNFRINYEYLQGSKKELETFLSDKDFLNSRDFSRKVMFTHELKANNTIEGIHDSMAIIEEAIKNASGISDKEKRYRITNLYKGYKFILEGKDIDEKNLLHLYSILSKDLLDHYNLTHMGEKYRNAPVYILNKGRLDEEPDQGLDKDRVEEFMDLYLSYINNGESFDSQTDYFIKSQIMHFYFVYIHPFFDINGRTSRTTAMWYLLNKEVYPYIIFNRGISFSSEYDSIIKKCKDFGELTLFVDYMMHLTKRELEKEYVMNVINSSTNRKWSSTDYQTLEYFLSLPNQRSVMDFVSFYNQFNDKKKVGDVYHSMLEPFIEDGTLEIERETKKIMFGSQKNLILRLSPNKLNDINREEITKINL